MLDGIWAATRDFQQCGILTSVDSDEPVQPPVKHRNSKWCSVSSLTVIEYVSDKQRLWSVCTYEQADLSLCWSHIPHFWKSHVTAHMEFNHSRCQVMRVTSSRTPLQTQYMLHEQVLEAVSSARYFEVDISSKLSWKAHVDRITAKANRSLRFIKQYIKNKPPQIQEMVYQSLVHSQLEYALAVWDLHIKDRSHKVEMVLRRAVWWTLSDYTRTNSVTSLQTQLNWQTLEGRRFVARLCPFYKFEMAWWLCFFPTICSPHIGPQGTANLWHSFKFILARTTKILLSNGNCPVECPPNQCCSCPKSLDLQGNFGLSSLPRLTIIHSSFILFHYPDARCLPKMSRGPRQYHKTDR